MRVLIVLLLALCALGDQTSARAAPPLSAYGKLPALERVELSPSGDMIAFVAVDGEARKLFVRKVGGDALVVKAIGSGKVRGIRWVGDDYVLVYASDTANFGTGIQALWRKDIRFELSFVVIVNVNKKSVYPMFDGHKGDIIGQSIYHDYGPRKINGRWYEFVNANTAPGFLTESTRLTWKPAPSPSRLTTPCMVITG